MYYPPKGFHTAREYNKLDFVAKKARHRCRASQLLSRVTASDLFFQDLPLRSKDFQTWCLKALEQQWKLNKASHQSPNNFHQKEFIYLDPPRSKEFFIFPASKQIFSDLLL